MEEREKILNWLETNAHKKPVFPWHLSELLYGTTLNFPDLKEE